MVACQNHKLDLHVQAKQLETIAGEYTSQKEACRVLEAKLQAAQRENSRQALQLTQEDDDLQVCQDEEIQVIIFHYKQSAACRPLTCCFIAKYLAEFCVAGMYMHQSGLRLSGIMAFGSLVLTIARHVLQRKLKQLLEGKEPLTSAQQAQLRADLLSFRLKDEVSVNTELRQSNQGLRQQLINIRAAYAAATSALGLKQSELEGELESAHVQPQASYFNLQVISRSILPLCTVCCMLIGASRCNHNTSCAPG